MPLNIPVSDQVRAAATDPLGSAANPFDAIVIGSGFGGAVTACRLVEAGNRICVLERGRRYGPADFPNFPASDLFAGYDESAPPPDLSRWLWHQDRGIVDVRDLGDAVSVQAAGYGGGSLIYANVHLRPPRSAFARNWPPDYTPKDEGEWTLEPYFDLAAYMLQVQTIPVDLVKTVRLRDAADVLTSDSTSAARTADCPPSTPQPAPHAPHSSRPWFKTPLAINFDRIGTFDRTGTNPFGREQARCDMRARCWMGCDQQAKNTLDLNYLARVETSGRADVRTMAEVTRIEKAGHFKVTYNDLLLRDDTPAEDTIHAHYVFLCAGSVNTTELLLRNPHLFPAGPPPALGSHYFPNADSFSVVFDCDEAHEADYGPTITSAMLFRRDAVGPCSQSLDFDGGVLTAAGRLPALGDVVRGKRSGAQGRLAHDPLLDWGNWHGNARGTLVLDEPRGAFLDGEPLDVGGVALAFARSPLVHHEDWFLAEDGGFPPDLEPLLGLFRSPLWLRRNRYRESPVVVPFRQPPLGDFRVKAFADALGGMVTSDLLREEIRSLLPEWLIEALENDRGEILGQIAAIGLPMLGRLLDELARSLAAQIPADLVSRFDLSLDGASVKKEVLIRGMLRQGLQVIGGSEVGLVDTATRVFTDGLPLSPEKLLDTAGRALVWALAYGATGGHTGMLLTMGRDRYRGRLMLAEDVVGGVRISRLRAALPGPVLDSSGTVQERVLRAVAKEAWHGELRTNPAWSPLSKRVTVHSQGGCPMGADRVSVTDASGAVHGCDGLYVMDAAAFPASVGVNPSAAIAAIAEYKIAQFIRRQREDDTWKSDDTASAKNFVQEVGRATLDPLNHMGGAITPRSLDLLGLTFAEKMEGFFVAVDNASSLLDNDLAGLHQELRNFRDAEQRGIEAGARIETQLQATVPDLALLTSSIGHSVKIALEGTVQLIESPHTATYPVRGTLQIFMRPPHPKAGSRTTSPPVPIRFFEYHLYFGEGTEAHHLRGRKVLRDDVGNDVWSDTSTVFFEFTRGEQRRRGILRVSLNDFLRVQLRSMDVTGTSDPARRSWALAAFYKYFATELADVYMTRARQLSQLFGKLLTGIHV